MDQRRSPRLGVFDIGSNTIRAMAAVIGPDGSLDVFGDEFRTTALGRGIAQTRMMPEDAITETVDFAAAFLQRYGPLDQTFAVGTAACRDATNAPQLQEALRVRCGVDLEVLSGEEEARLTYIGAASALGNAGAEGLLVADIGGRSTELAVEREGNITGISLPLGARALTETYLQDDPPSPAHISAARAHATEVLLASADITSSARVFIAAGGTACSAALLAGGARELGLREVAGLRRELCAMPLAERRERLHFDPPRAEVICGGLIALELYTTRAPERRIHISMGGIREGVLIERGRSPHTQRDVPS